jgi:mono/diheme cytochrome c family protein
VGSRVASVISAVLIVAIGAGLFAVSASSRAVATPAALVGRGRYLAKIAGCNDCHTARYAETGGAVSESDWLTGSPLGWRGPWGTTYPVNLRLYMNDMSEAQWLATARSLRSRPPMPWFALRDMSDEDLRALYAFVRSLGRRGEPAPAYVPPGQVPPMPYVQFPPPPPR